MKIQITINDTPVEIEQGRTILQAANQADIYIPSLCTHPELPGINKLQGAAFVFRGSEKIESDDPTAAWDGCGICTVEANGEPVRACNTEATDGMTIITNSASLQNLRREKIFAYLDQHPHACLTCAQAEGCPRTQCSSNVPEAERCCVLLGNCELQRLAEFVGVPENLPKYKNRGLPVLNEEPLFDYNTELCIGCLRCVRACRDLRGVGALDFVIKNGRPVVGTTVDATRTGSHCRFCGACVEVCPTGALLDKVRAVGEERIKTLVPCKAGCPAGIDIPVYVRAIAKGDTDKAIAVIREKLPLPHSIGRVCFHPCEEVCRRGELGGAISICQLKRFALDEDSGAWRSRQKKLPASGKQVAVIGSGPAGLTAAFYLAKQGHAVTILEAQAEPGGMLRLGIPEYRLPVEFLKKDIAEITAIGVTIQCNTAVDAAKLEQLASRYDAVFAASGANEAKKINLPGSDLPAVYWGVEFLRERALGKIAADAFLDKQVVVVGGGNVAMDSARVALRLAAAGVTVVSLESPEELPAWDWEVEEAVEEGIQLLHRWGPAHINETGGSISSLQLKRCTAVFDADGRFSPTYNENETKELPADVIILSIGQEPSSGAFDALGLRRNRTIETGKDSLVTKINNVFAGGDVVSGPASVVEAVAMGRTAASQIDQFLGGDGCIDEQLTDRDPIDHYLGKVEGFAALERQKAAVTGPDQRKGSFAAFEETFTAAEARAEAARCLACHLRLEIARAAIAPKHEELMAFNAETVAALPESEGVYQLLDEEKKVLSIKGVMNLKEALVSALEENDKARYFIYEEEPMFTKRESELIQQYLQEHGELPGGGADDLDDLF